MRKIIIVLLMTLLFSCTTMSVKSSTTLLSKKALDGINSTVIVHITQLAVEGGELIAIGGLGSGFLIDKTHVVTNHHVVDGSFLTTIETSTGSTMMARVVYSNPKTDIAIIETEAEIDAVPLEIETQSKVGDQVLIIGNPSSDYFLHTTGIISTIKEYDGVKHIHSDAKVYFGSSGSAMINMDGKVVGIIHAFYGDHKVAVAQHAIHIIEAIETWKASKEFLNSKK